MKELTAYVYISNNSIKVITAAPSKKNKLNVTAFYEEEFEEGCILNGIIMNSFVLHDQIMEMWKKYNLPAKDVYLVVNESSITTKHMKIPQMAPNNVVNFIRTEFKDVDGIQNMLVDYSVVVPKNQDGSCSIFTVISTKEFVSSYIDLFHEAKVELSCIDSQQNCIIKLMKSFRSLTDKTFALAILDKNTLIECLFSNNDFVTTRRSRIFSTPEEDTFQREIGQHINSLIQFQKAEQTGAEITDFFLCGFPDNASGLADFYSQSFGIKVASFPDYLPGDITAPEGFVPSKYIELLGAVAKYS